MDPQETDQESQNALRSESATTQSDMKVPSGQQTSGCSYSNTAPDSAASGSLPDDVEGADDVKSVFVSLYPKP